MLNAKIPVQGISTYAEPGDWFTYELNHYSLANLSWNPHLSVDSLINDYCLIRYGTASTIAKEAYTLLEEVVRNYASIPFTTVKSKNEIVEAKNKLAKAEMNLRKSVVEDQIASTNVSRLLLMIKYAILDLQILQRVTENATADEIEREVKDLVAFLQDNSRKGVFLVSINNNLTRYLKYYNNRKS